MNAGEKILINLLKLTNLIQNWFQLNETFLMNIQIYSKIGKIQPGADCQ